MLIENHKPEQALWKRDPPGSLSETYKRPTEGRNNALDRHCFKPPKAEFRCDRPVDFPVILGKAFQVSQQIDQQTQKQMLSGFIDELQAQSNYLSNLKQHGIVQYLKDGLADAAYICPVTYPTNPEDPDWQRLGKSSSGKYLSSEDRIVVRGPAPGAAEIWKDLLLYGRLPGQIDTLHHEMIHRNQMLNLSLFRGTLSLFHDVLDTGRTIFQPAWKRDWNYRTMLLELQAHSARMLSAGAHGDFNSELGAVAAVLSSATNRHSATDVQTILAERSESGRQSIPRETFQKIYQLRLLGWSETDLSKLIWKCHFNFRTESFPALDQALQTEQMKSGIISEKDFAEDLKLKEKQAEAEISELRREVQRQACEHLLSY